MTRWTPCALACAAFFATTRAHAQEPGCGGEAKQPWVAVAHDPRLSEAEAERVRRELRADLAPREIDVCDASRAGAPIARVVLSPATDVQGVSIRVEIRDALTAKDVARTLDTSNTPTDGRAVAIALATAELLRASWAELALRAAPPAVIAVPPPVLRIVDASLARPATPPRRIVGLSIALASEVFTSGFARFGVDARLTVDLGERFTAEARVGFRRALDTTTVDGTVDADAFVFGAGGSVPLFARDRRWGIDALARIDVAEITFHAAPTAGATATTATLASVEASAGVRARFALTPSLAFFVELGGGAPIIAASAKDGTDVVATTNGALFFAALAARGKF